MIKCLVGIKDTSDRADDLTSTVHERARALLSCLNRERRVFVARRESHGEMGSDDGKCHHCQPILSDRRV